MAGDKKKITDIPFMKAYNFLLNKAGLTSAEKLVLTVICRFWPNPYWDSNREISKALGFTERYVEKVIKSLAEKRIIKRGYGHMVKNGKPHTVRVIVARCFPKIPGHRIKWVTPEHMDGEQPEHTDGHCPNNSSFLPEQMDDLLDENRRRKERKAGQQTGVQRFKNSFGRQPGRQRPEPTAAEREQRRQAQMRALLASGDKKS